jgi:hypothetical protein
MTFYFMNLRRRREGDVGRRKDEGLQRRRRRRKGEDACVAVTDSSNSNLPIC